MYLAYSLLLTLGLLILIPRFLFQAVAYGKYVSGFRERLGSIAPIPNQAKPTIWLHCVSVGETQAARPLVSRLRRDFPEHAIVVSTITRTGQKLAREVFKDQAVSFFYFPFDWRWSTRRALRRVEPAIVLVMETELWPNFLKECKNKQVPVALVNGRISRQSFRRYRLIRSFMSRVLASLDIAVMQSDEDAKRLCNLGMPSRKISVGGNLKFDSPPVSATAAATEQLRQRFNLSSEGQLILAASTHFPEEQIVLDSFRTLNYRQNHRTRLLLAPRHPERFQEVAALLQKSGLSWTRRTNATAASDQTADVILLDTIGELPATYSLASIVFVGGSIADKGGHNVLEPAAAGKAVITGASTHNFSTIVSLLNEADAIVQMRRVETANAAVALREAIDDLLINADRRQELGTRARQMVMDNQGAAEKTVELIRPLLTTTTPAVSSLPATDALIT